MTSGKGKIYEMKTRNSNQNIQSFVVLNEPLTCVLGKLYKYTVQTFQAHNTHRTESFLQHHSTKCR